MFLVHFVFLSFTELMHEILVAWLVTSRKRMCGMCDLFREPGSTKRNMHRTNLRLPHLQRQACFWICSCEWICSLCHISLPNSPSTFSTSFFPPSHSVPPAFSDITTTLPIARACSTMLLLALIALRAPKLLRLPIQISHCCFCCWSWLLFPCSHAHVEKSFWVHQQVVSFSEKNPGAYNQQEYLHPQHAGWCCGGCGFVNLWILECGYMGFFDMWT